MLAQAVDDGGKVVVISTLAAHILTAQADAQALIDSETVVQRDGVELSPQGETVVVTGLQCNHQSPGAIGEVCRIIKAFFCFPVELLQMESPPMADFLESYISMKYHVQIRFGRWREIIAEPMPDDVKLYCHTTASLHYAKAVAHSALGEVAEAEAERAKFLEARAKVPESRYLHNCRCIDLLEVAEQMMDGELEYRKGNFDTAFGHLHKAVELEDALPYDEPWGWIQPVRHALGALALEQGRIDEAENTYREDLGLAGDLPRACIHPDNVWSLKGLYECLRQRNQAESAEGKIIGQKLELAVARSDLPVGASCHCAQAAMQAAAAE